MTARVDLLADESAIRDTLARYWRGIDRRDVALVASAYHPDAQDDHGYFEGSVEGFLESLEPSVWRFFEKTFHFSGQIAVDFDPSCPDRAVAESYAEAHHLRRGEDGALHDLVYGLRYVDAFERRDEEWRIARRVCAWDWARTDPCGAIPLPDTYARGRNSRADPVFGQPQRTGAPESLDTLAIKRACSDTLARYARGVDRCDVELVASAYHPDAYDDHGGYQGDAAGFVAWVKPTVMDAFTCTMHKLGNQLIVVEEGRAWAETYAIAHHVQGDSDLPTDMIMGVRYLDTLEDRGDGWKIADRRMTFEWERSVEIGSQTEYEGFARGRRDGSDPALAPRTTVAVPVGSSEMAEHAEIQAALFRYCRGVDRRDPDLIRSTYHADAFDDHGVYKGDLEGFLEFVEREVWARFRTTMHKLGQALIEIDGDVASAETYAVCHHVIAENGRDVADSVMGIRYLDRFERRAGCWRIARRELRWEWIRLDALVPLDADWTLGRADAHDPVCLAVSGEGPGSAAGESGLG
ncbi:MAG: nuclear transport factor 2 family protein [bacterium]|nr:nuclear transport factor 2 family protein [bacterium]